MSQEFIKAIHLLSDRVEKLCVILEAPVTDDDVLWQVCRQIGTTSVAVQRKGRTKEQHLARLAVIEELIKRGWSDSRIGRALCRDHSAIAHHRKALQPA